MLPNAEPLPSLHVPLPPPDGVGTVQPSRLRQRAQPAQPARQRSLEPLAVISACAVCAAGTVTSQWQPANLTSSPTARRSAAMAATPAGVLLFGGSDGITASNATWSWDGAAWTQLTPAASPTAKFGHAMVYDVVRGVVVMFGGMNTTWLGGPSVDQTWQWDGAAWTQLTPTTTPGGLGNHGMAFDLARNRVVVYGGTPNSLFASAASGTWEFDGTNWAPIATANNPGPLERPAMCYHVGAMRTVLFGGTDPQAGSVDTTWLYDGASWTAAPIAGNRPARRTGARMVYDSVRGVCVLIGGVHATLGNALLDTWEFDGANWTLVNDAPTGRVDASLAYDEPRRRVVLFGGADPASLTNLADTWEYSRSLAIGAGCAGSSGVPTLTDTAGPRLGQNYVQRVTNLHPTAPIAVFVLSLVQLPATPLAGIGMPGCTAYVSPDVLFARPAGSGNANLSAPIPNVVGLLGISLCSQALSLDPGVNAASLTTSNALEGSIGP